jgi:hypothetical protein
MSKHGFSSVRVVLLLRRSLRFKATAVDGAIKRVSVVISVLGWRGVDLVRSEDDNVSASDVKILVPFEFGSLRTLHLVAEDRRAVLGLHVQLLGVGARLGEPFF